MISEKRFAFSFTSFWRELIPTGDTFVRTLNLIQKRFCDPLDSDFAPPRRGMINEIGFLAFRASARDKSLLEPRNLPKEQLDRICTSAWDYIRRFRSYATLDFAPPDEAERAESIEIAKRLQLFFEEYETGETIAPSPEFDGCGILDDCKGDILVGRTLYEVKAGERNFRLVDIRQLLVYLALNQSSDRYEINSVGLLNPRVGVFVQVGVDDFTKGVSGKSRIGLLSEIIEFVSSGGISR